MDLIVTVPDLCLLFVFRAVEKRLENGKCLHAGIATVVDRFLVSIWPCTKRLNDYQIKRRK